MKRLMLLRELSCTRKSIREISCILRKTICTDDLLVINILYIKIRNNN